jgi:2-polyprenyl-3-methyl-5-hydroxy-6-metoxy-1,4-benzoquinol methylase
MKNTDITVEDYYNNFYKELSKLDEQGNTFDKIKNFLPQLQGNEKILDIGCGHGSVTHQLVKDGFDVYGVEINDDAIKSLTEKGFHPIKADISKPLNINNKFDIVLLLDVLEHVFDPLFLLRNAKNHTNRGGYIIITVPLYFDIIDRIKILFTGSVISLDNLCYGKNNYKKFRSYNYDHIRFFRPKEILEMGKILNLKIDKIDYISTGYAGNNLLLKILVKLIANKLTVKLSPNLFAHSMKIRWQLN